MPETADIKSSAHDVRNNIHAFEMALMVLEQDLSAGNRQDVMGLLKSEIADTKRNVERLIQLVEAELRRPR